ncbi:hypothetical protein DEO72_LG8g931 [Vigna unguiculata]|uniref:Uncharacterized protein n=1 Tax=Vigna unguiculata TaxID=3917 RepID=A0A4D6MSR4_VIGUN|nr:hypothetical protein DEO72_LG8g931 [Vigna unguiculata]
MAIYRKCKRHVAAPDPRNHKTINNSSNEMLHLPSDRHDLRSIITVKESHRFIVPRSDTLLNGARNQMPPHPPNEVSALAKSTTRRSAGLNAPRVQFQLNFVSASVETLIYEVSRQVANIIGFERHRHSLRRVRFT